MSGCGQSAVLSSAARQQERQAARAACGQQKLITVNMNSLSMLLLHRHAASEGITDSDMSRTTARAAAAIVART